MKMSYIFAAILCSSLAGTLLGHRTAKTIFAVISGGFSIYGLARLLG